MKPAPDRESPPLRIAPLLTRHGREETLPYAPPPWQLKRCLETDIVFSPTRLLTARTANSSPTR